MPEYEKNKFTWLMDYNINITIDIGANVDNFTSIYIIFKKAL